MAELHACAALRAGGGMVAIWFGMGYYEAGENFGERTGEAMSDSEQCHYEVEILKHRRFYIFYAVVAVAIPVVALGMVWATNSQPLWIARSGALMACVAFLAHLSAGSMTKVLSPGGMVSMTYSTTRAKYIGAIKRYDKIAIAIVILGTVVWGFGDLIPVGAVQA
ncbi:MULTISPECIES: hypothetical protein [Pseudomonas]|uniref:hypothetical protein n=1 Tax=Pseudomonas TaxID=286 RepID=UPI00211956F1|nr:hypothetical protein [Pseudomonas kurunegalensis]